MKNQKTGGRTAGTPNKLTRTIKESLEMAFDGIGGTSALTKWAKSHQSEFYRIYSKLLPTNIKADVETTHKVDGIFFVSDSNEAEIIQRYLGDNGRVYINDQE
jgi:UV DNA damage repair endonuclease